VTEKIPQVKAFKFFVTKDQIVLVSPQNTVADVISKQQRAGARRQVIEWPTIVIEWPTIANVRFSFLAHIRSCTAHVRFRG
jgi:hypothetical protein